MTKTSSILHIGFDDTDSRNGMCTTFLAYKIVQYLKNERVRFLDFPRLIRFNPNIPWKTRGNGAVALKIKTEKPETIKKNITNFVKKYSLVNEGANPGLVFYQKNKIPANLSNLSKIALSKLISRSQIRKFTSTNNIESFFLGNGQGLVGSVGAIGYRFDDHTFELLSYRREVNFGKKRKISKESVKKMHRATYSKTFNSFDEQKDRILVAPHGLDPVLFGIRGNDPSSVIEGAKIIKANEKIDGYMIFRSNQGTGAHLENEFEFDNLKAFSSGTLIGTISSSPEIINGGHCVFSITKEGHSIPCAVYKPTGLTKIASKLIVGDFVKVGGGIRKASKYHKRTLNIEFIEVLNLAQNEKLINPSCNFCQKRMKSKGKNQGFECTKCKRKAAKKILIEIPREIEKKMYIPVPSAHRHLTRPMIRMGKKNRKILFSNSKNWFYISK